MAASSAASRPRRCPWRNATSSFNHANLKVALGPRPKHVRDGWDSQNSAVHHSVPLRGAGLCGYLSSCPPHHHPLPRVPTGSRHLAAAKRRWRGTAVDGPRIRLRSSGADPTRARTLFNEGENYYVIEQEPEEVLEIPVTTLEQAARVAWSLGNLHFGVQVLAELGARD